MSKEQTYHNREKSMPTQPTEPNYISSKTDPKTLQSENKFIRKQNQILRKELQNISIRLDGEIKKRLQDQKKKPSTKVEDISQMQLQNAYKKCQIYKKEVNYYKKKLDSVPDMDRLEEYQKKIAEHVKQNQQLKEELKHIKKINKLQEKGLAQVGAEGYIKIVSQNQKLNEEVRILKKQIDDERRGKLKIIKTKTSTDNFSSNKPQSKVTDKDIKFQQQVKKRIRTQSNNESNQQELSSVLQQKLQKDYIKMKALMSEKTRLRQMVDNLKMQLSDKQKEISHLREKVNALRMNNQVLQSQVNSRVDNHTINQEVQEPSPKRNNIKKSKSKLQGSKRRVWKRPASDNQSQLLNSSVVGKYPRVQQRGSKMSKMQNIIKWSHQTLTSKIKQIHILLHESGHIKDIHAKYEKGEPKKYDGKGKYIVLTCGEDEYVRFISGCFYDDYLQYLMVITNQKRVQKFGKWKQFQKSDEGQSFQFQVGENEFPGALFGENDQIGVRRLGCFIHKQG